VLNTGGLSVGSLFRLATEAQAGPSEPVVKEAEEQALAGTMAADVEERVDALIKQLEDTDHQGIHMFSILSLISGFFVFSFDRNGVFHQRR
jgi:predicted TIM-barrel enzyme